MKPTASASRYLCSGVIAIDLDKCVGYDPDTGDRIIAPWAQQLIDKVPHAYCEITVPGTGLRLIGLGEGAEVHNAYKEADGSGIELFRNTARYITVSGLELTKCSELPLLDDFLDGLHADREAKKQADLEAEKRQAAAFPPRAASLSERSRWRWNA